MPKAANQNYIDVTAAIIEKDGKFLIAQRNKDKHQGGLWEFPGGKIEADETPEQCLKRELKEEFHVDCIIEEYFCESLYDYGIKKIRLIAYFVSNFPSEYTLNDHEEINWITIHQFKDYQFAPADIPIVQKLMNFKLLKKG